LPGWEKDQFVTVDELVGYVYLDDSQLQSNDQAHLPVLSAEE